MKEIIFMNEVMLTQLSNYTVLYAEDDEGVRVNVAEMLNLIFKKVLMAQDGLEAYELFLEYKPELVITDIKMPKLNGMDLARKIRKEDTKIQILIMSAHTEVDFMLEAIDLSLMKYLVKPITQTKLFDALDKFLQTQKIDNLVTLKDGWGYNSAKKVTVFDEKEFELTKKESKLLEMLLHKKSVLTYSEIEQELWKDEHMSLNALRLLIKNLRKKLPEGYLKNIQSIGYKL